jgi:hypothetical protein
MVGSNKGRRSRATNIRFIIRVTVVGGAVLAGGGNQRLMPMNLWHQTTLACAEQIRLEGFRNGTREGDRPCVFFGQVGEGFWNSADRPVLVEVQLAVNEPGPGWHVWPRVDGNRVMAVYCIPDKILNALVTSIRIYDGSDEPRWESPGWAKSQESRTDRLDVADSPIPCETVLPLGGQSGSVVAHRR